MRKLDYANPRHGRTRRTWARWLGDVLAATVVALVILTLLGVWG